MKIERTDNKIILRIPASMDVNVIQDVIKYLTAMEIDQKSKAKQKDIHALAKEVRKESSRVKNKKRLAK